MTTYEGTLCGCDDPAAHLQAMLTGEPPRECDEHRREREQREAAQQRREQIESYAEKAANAIGLPDRPSNTGEPPALNSPTLEANLAAALGGQTTTNLD